MEELKRFEEKQKLTNLQIEKRFVQLDESLEQLKTEIENLSTLEDIPRKTIDFDVKIDQIQDEIEKIKQERKKELEQVTTLVASNDITKELNELRGDLIEFKGKFQSELNTIQLLKDQLLKNKVDEKIHNLIVKIKETESKLNGISLRLSSFEQQKLSEPIFID